MSRSPSNNPFRPGAGAVPDVWVGRADLLPVYERERTDRTRGRYTSGTVFIGPSGIGKSVLVNRFAQRAIDDGDVVLDAVRVAKRSDPVSHLAGALEKARRHIAGEGTLTHALESLLARLQVISVKGVQFAIEQEGIANPHLVVRDSLIAIGEVLARENVSRPAQRQRSVIVRIDELQNADNTQRSALLSALGDVLEHEVELDARDGTSSSIKQHLPVLLYITGLPDLLNRTTNVDTFRRRFDTIPLGVFTDAEVIDALLDTPLPGGVAFSRQAAEAMADIVTGDPFLFQLVGKHAWDASDGDEVTPADVAHADDATYSERLRVIEAASSDIPDGEAQVLEAIYALVDEQLSVRGSEVAARLDKTAPQIATAAQRLERRAAIRRTKGAWRVEHRLLYRYRTTGDIVPDRKA
jgi:hypothetical protein